MGFSKCSTGVTGEAIANRILQHLSNWQLPPENLRGQTYDGAGAMAGKTKGAAAHISKEHPKALYMHCNVHVLNLCVVKCCSIQDVNNVMEIADKVCHFFCNSPKRQLALEKIVDQELPEEQRTRLKSLCVKLGGWSAMKNLRFLLTFSKQLFPRWMRSPEKQVGIRRADAASLSLVLNRFPFIFRLMVTKEVLGMTKGLSIKLQKRAMDIAKAFDEIGTVKATLQKSRDGVEAFRERVFDKAKAIAADVDVEVSVPRVVGRQVHRSNTPSSSPSQHFRRQLTIPLLDHLCGEIEERFNHALVPVVKQLLQLLPSSIAARDSPLTSDELPDLLSLYSGDLPAPSALDTELLTWNTKWQLPSVHDKDRASLNSVVKLLGAVDRHFFPNPRVLLQIAATMAVTSAECERSISRLRYIKTCLRSTMAEERLNGLTPMYVNRDRPIDVPAVIDEFARRHPRRM